MTKLALRALSALLLIAAAALPALAAPPVPETLTYRLTWHGMEVGSSTIETKRTDSGLEIVSKVASAAWSAPFYKVEDVETSKLKKAGDGFALGSYRMHLQEGSNHWQRAVSINPATGKVQHVDLLTFEKHAYPFAGQAWDPVSSMFHLRRLPLAVGKPVEITVIDRQGPKKIRVEVLRKESVTVPAGTFRTLVVSPQMNISSEGLFYAHGPLTVWLTDDDRKVPVVIEKRIQGLFNQGIPAWLQPFIPDSVKADIPVLETVRAELVRQ